VPEGTPSGVYYLNGFPDLFFIVRQTVSPPAPVVILMPTHTLNAYSVTLGRSLYKQPTMVQSVSFLRPQQLEKSAEWRGFLRWVLEAHPFGVAPPAYIADVDMEDTAILAGAKVLVVPGHSEYWTRAAREVFDAFIARGGSAVMAGGDDMWWQIRLSDDHRTLHEYRLDKPPEQGGDPIADPKLRTVYWHNPKLGYPVLPSIGGQFTYGGYGARGKENGQFTSTMQVASAGSPLLAGTGLGDCDEMSVSRSTEWDGAPILGLDAVGKPVPDIGKIGVSRFELIAYEWNHNGPRYLLGTMHVLQRAPGLGYVLHMGGLGCCMSDEFYTDATHGKPQVQTILRNAVSLFLSGGDPFSKDAGTPRPVAYPMVTPWLKEMPAVPPGPCAPRLPEPGSVPETE